MTLQTTPVQVLGETVEMLTEGTVAAYRDLVRLPGGVDDLKSIPADQIERIQFLNGFDATTRFGTEHPQGRFW